MVEARTLLERARRNLRNSEVRIGRQREIVSGLKAANRPAERSEKLLATFEGLHALRISYLKILEAKAGSQD